MLLGRLKTRGDCSEHFLLGCPVGQIDNQILFNVSKVVVVDVDSWLGQTTCLTDLVAKHVIEDMPYGCSG